MDGAVVRPAHPGDGQDLARGWIETGRYYANLDPAAFQIPAADGLAQWFEELLQQPRSQQTLWLVAEVDGRVVGTVEARLERPIDSAARQLLRDLGQARVFVEALSVEEAYRRQGVGSRLMDVDLQGAEKGRLPRHRRVGNGQPSITGRGGLDMAAWFAELAGLAGALGRHQVVLDGELVALDATGRPDFTALQQRTRARGRPRAAGAVAVVYVVFDLLWLDGRELLARPWAERRVVLEALGQAGLAW